MKNTIKFALLAVSCCLLASCAGMTAAEVAGATAATGGAIAGIVEALKPFLPPEAVADLTVRVGQAQTLVDAVAAGIGQLGQSLADVKAQQAAEKAANWTTGEIAAAGTGAAATITGVAIKATNILRDAKYKPTAAPAA